MVKKLKIGNKKTRKLVRVKGIKESKIQFRRVCHKPTTSSRAIKGKFNRENYLLLMPPN